VELSDKTLAQWLCPRVEFPFGGKHWPLVFTHRALLMTERSSGVDMLNADIREPSASLTRALLFSALSVAGADCTLTAVGKLTRLSNLPKIQVTLRQAWIASMPEVRKEREEKPAGSPEPKLTWLEAWACAREQHCLTDDQWLDMTPRQFRALQDLRLEQMQREELLVGIIASTVETFSYFAPKKPQSPKDFMLHKLPELGPEPYEGDIGELIMKSMQAGKNRKVKLSDIQGN
jgi:hypothetical protein